MVSPDFVLQHSTKIRFGRGVVGEVAVEVKELGGERVLVVCDSGIVRAGIASRVTEIPEHAGMTLTVFSDVSANPRDTECAAAAEGRRLEVDVIVALGGGSAMDCAKAAAVLIANGGNVADWEAPKLVDVPGLPVVCIPTTAGTGSEVTCFAIITDSERHYKTSLFGPNVSPRTALVDPDLTISLPVELTASTGMDALTHAIESYTCRVAEPITDILALEATTLISANLGAAVRDGRNSEARTNLMLGSLMAGLAFGNSDCGSVHSMAEAIGGLYDTPHGVANAVFLPLVFEFNCVADPGKHARIAEALGVDRSGMNDDEAAQCAVEAIRELNSACGMPAFGELPNVDAADFPALARVAEEHPCTADNARDIVYDDYLVLFERAYTE